MKIINEFFDNHKDFDLWAETQDQNNVDFIKIDGKTPDFWSICIYHKEHFKMWDSNLVLLAPMEAFYTGNHEYDVTYPQIGPIDWKTLEVLEEYTEEEAVRELTKDEKAKVIDLGDESDD